MIAGHTHRDYDNVLYDIPYVMSMDGTAEGAQDEGWSNARLCTFDMCIADWSTKKLNMVRVGYGSDRTIDIL